MFNSDSSSEKRQELRYEQELKEAIELSREEHDLKVYHAEHKDIKETIDDARNRFMGSCVIEKKRNGFDLLDHEDDDDDGVHDFEAETLYGTNAQLIKSLFAKTPVNSMNSLQKQDEEAEQASLESFMSVKRVYWTPIADTVKGGCWFAEVYDSAEQTLVYVPVAKVLKRFGKKEFDPKIVTKECEMSAEILSDEEKMELYQEKVKLRRMEKKQERKGSDMSDDKNNNKNNGVITPPQKVESSIPHPTTKENLKFVYVLGDDLEATALAFFTKHNFPSIEKYTKKVTSVIISELKSRNLAKDLHQHVPYRPPTKFLPTTEKQAAAAPVYNNKQIEPIHPPKEAQIRTPKAKKEVASSSRESALISTKFTADDKELLVKIVKAIQARTKGTLFADFLLASETITQSKMRTTLDPNRHDLNTLVEFVHTLPKRQWNNLIEKVRLMAIDSAAVYDDGSEANNTAPTRVVQQNNNNRKNNNNTFAAAVELPRQRPNSLSSAIFPDIIKKQTSATPFEQVERSKNTAPIYVYDLESTVLETQLYELFSPIVIVSAIEVYKDPITRKSLGYAYVILWNEQENAIAIEAFNGHVLNGKPIRVLQSPEYKEQQQQHPIKRWDGDTFFQDNNGGGSNEKVEDVIKETENETFSPHNNDGGGNENVEELLIQILELDIENKNLKAENSEVLTKLKAANIENSNLHAEITKLKAANFENSNLHVEVAKLKVANVENSNLQAEITKLKAMNARLLKVAQDQKRLHEQKQQQQQQQQPSNPFSTSMITDDTSSSHSSSQIENNNNNYNNTIPRERAALFGDDMNFGSLNMFNDLLQDDNDDFLEPQRRTNGGGNNQRLPNLPPGYGGQNQNKGGGAYTQSSSNAHSPWGHAPN